MGMLKKLPSFLKRRAQDFRVEPHHLWLALAIIVIVYGMK